MRRVVLAVLAAAAACSGGATSSPSTTVVLVTTTVPPTTVESTSATAAPTAPPTTDPRSCARSWPVATRVAQLVMPAVRGQDMAAVAAELGALGVGGVIVTTWPEEATAETLAALKAAGAVPMLVAVDEEGGDVQRLRRLGRLPSAAEVAATLDPAGAQARLAAHAEVVAALGFDMVFAPVVDVAPVSRRGPMAGRTFSSDPEVVADFAAAYVRAWQSAGVLPVLKHFPGHGRAGADSHDGVAATPPLEELRIADLVPYERLHRLGAGVMVGHLDVPGLTEEGVPASLSSAAITGLLRGELGYVDALVVTDALGMGAVVARFGVADAAVRAVAAGADLALVGSAADTGDVIAALVEAVTTGRITEARLTEAVDHVLAAKRWDCP